ncbi:putative inactive DNA (cytosine-5)-methyltransferase DRM3 [Curcuma longa]|uniref:putative inactive DNA (cytosine-5)-methyltransferase DRM3 n=1 Tax=Curcuma longa TaxID=136217 RepID=UPI003D9EC643
MVKIEDCSDSGSSSDLEIVDQRTTQVSSSASKLRCEQDSVDEQSFPSSSSSQLKSYFVGMGFGPALVDKVFQENGEADTELLLEVLIKLSSSSAEVSNCLDDFSSFVKEEDDIEWDDDFDTKDSSLPSFQDGDKRSYLLMMNFSEEEVDLAINQLGEDANLPELADFIVTSQTVGSSRVNDMQNDEEPASEALFGTMDKTLHLLQMGFTEEEVSTAIDIYGSEVSVQELADSIFARRHKLKIEGLGVVGNNIKAESDYIEDVAVEETRAGYSASGTWESNASSSNYDPYDYEEKVRVKKARGTILNDETFFSHGAQHPKWESTWESKPFPYGEDGKSGSSCVKEEFPERRMPNPNGNVRATESKLPYFFYANVVDISEETWRRLSGFLYGTEPENGNCQYFSAFIRKEGYMHNLPKERRFKILPEPPMTLQDALPHTRKWWPSWDTRKQLSCINTEKVVPLVFEQLRKIMIDSQGMVSKEQQMKILHQCKTLNLMWVGQYKLTPIEPEEVECILGYPRNHTQSFQLEPYERLRTLKYSFQTDTLGYYFSPLKALFPDGMRVLSVYSGIGGAEVALHRLGIHLKCVVSVEASEVNRKIMKRWWQYTSQTGELIQIGGIEKLTTQVLESFVQKFGGFDLILGGNPGPYVSGGFNVSSMMGMDQNLFFEFVRVFQRVRGSMRRNN